MRDTDFAYASAYTRTMENRMLSKADFEALLHASSYNDAMRILLDKGYGRQEKTLDLEVLIQEELSFVWDEITDACPEDAPISILLYPADFHNMKAVLKSIFSGVAHEPLVMAPYTVDPDEIRRAMTDGKPDDLPEMLRAPADEAYHVLAQEGDGQRADIILDLGLYSAMGAAAERAGSAFLTDWVDINIALMDLKVALRGASGGMRKEFFLGAMLPCKRLNTSALADDASQGGLADVLSFMERSGFEKGAEAARSSAGAFEKWCDNQLIQYACAARMETFGMAPALGFFIGKEFELRGVRMILSGIRSGIEADTLRERLRDTYV